MTPILPDPIDETRRILGRAEASGIALRAMGGVGVALRAPSVQRVRPARAYDDIDLAGATPGGRIVTLFAELGYQPSGGNGPSTGTDRLRFHDPSGRRVDVYLDLLRMCHDLSFRDRLTVDRATLSLADLLLSKLQIVELTDRDGQDIAALLADHELTDDDAAIGLRRIAAICANDWGWWKTVDDNLRRLIEHWQRQAATTSIDESQILGTAIARAMALRDRLAATPKSTAWRLRAVVGDRVRWYEEPDEPR
jgi:hypothetical protein